MAASLLLLGSDSRIVFNDKAIAEDVGTNLEHGDASPLSGRFTILEFVAALAAITAGRVIRIELRILCRVI